ncbi:hypothetical protein GYMLUDRAFT_48114 [Collybiopsis luxurians FD-317 M1]|uniref:amidase n=1 Tax=Collybiopsis luxurians FD-317 M1 TaxID=944289 RepID=A0A0D0CJH0_9AGAR|nr:hypothetical protein GYMLUDRAFT_48114 [Collybiopsis luxurians FD-317 M1]
MWFSGGQATAKAVTEQKQAERERLIAAAPINSLTPNHEQYLKAGAHEIVSQIEKGEWTARQVVEAYIAQAVAAHRATNCVTEVLFDQALKRAEELDAQFASTKQLVGPLHGVPFSAKSQYDVANFDTTVGFTTWTNRPAESNAVLIDQLRSLGAIGPIVKTNVPQTMLAFECKNPLWGRSTNPYNDKYTCGGSTGGEGALLAMDGSAIGIGSDIGGSLRIPAAYCGIYALKPSFGRVTRGGTRSSNEGFEAVKAVAGPMTRNVKDLELFCQSIFGLPDDKQLDYSYVPMPYRTPALPKRLKFGYYTADGFAKAAPACRRAVSETIEALRREGHECVEIEIPDTTEYLKTFLALVSADGFERLIRPLGPDSMEPTLMLPVYGARIPYLIRKLAVWVCERFLGDSIFADLIRASRVKSVAETVDWTAKRNNLNALFYEMVWNKYQLDGIICPVQAVPQIPHGGAAEVNSLVISTVLYNLVDCPVGNIPVTHVDATRDQLTEEWTSPPKSESRSVLIENRLYGGKEPMYDPVKMDGMPVCVQVVGRKWEDEKVIAMMSVVDDALGGLDRGFGPRAFAGQVKS